MTAKSWTKVVSTYEIFLTLSIEQKQQFLDFYSRSILPLAPECAKDFFQGFYEILQSEVA